VGRKVNPGDVLDDSRTLRWVHTFLWNRWYMNSTYYRVFVYGLIDFAKAVFANLESLVFDKITAFVSDSTIAIGKLLHVFETRVYDPALNVGIPTTFIQGGRVLKVFENRVYDPALNVGIPTAFIWGGEVLFNDLETNVFDRGLNEGIPAAATGLYHHIKKLQTGVLSYNIIYIVIVFLVLILSLVYWYMYGGI